ncbi:MaoC/PaaZ C-terminal domain-containing protein [Marmoricola sp. RAF53]|uniref:MaoC/PaaZ C-terminal domain-containing protein n=1 Tax=Marmoricola sp. RAF53 TaxID=3233059 RepID=UPI003F96D0C9
MAEQKTTLEPRTYRVTRADLVAYAAASGDQNPIHQDEAVATAVGLPGVIAHGMYTLALAARYVDEWTGEPGRIAELGAKFTKPVVVPAGDEGTEVTVAGVAEVRDGVETVALTVTCGDDKVLGNPRAVLRA